jgi:sugar diacid utilization regulator
MPSVDEILAAPALAGLRRVTRQGGGRPVTGVRLAEQFVDLDAAPAGCLVLLARAPSAAATDYRFDMAVRLASLHDVAAIAVLAGPQWQPPATAADIADRAGLALIRVPEQAELTALLLAIMREAGGDAERALLRAAQGLRAVQLAAQSPAGVDDLLAAVGIAVGTQVRLEHAGAGSAGADGAGGRVPVLVGDEVAGYLTAGGADGDLAVAVQLVLHAAAAAAGRVLSHARRARELPIRSRSGLLAELLMSDAALRQDLLDRGRRLGLPLDHWHVAIRFEPENLDQASRDEVHSFEILEMVGQTALQALGRAGGHWCVATIGEAIVAVSMTGSEPGQRAAREGVRAAERAAAAVGQRVPALALRGGVGTPHEGPLGLRASAAEARLAIATARAAGQGSGVTAHDAAGVQRMLMEWYASDTARASVRAQLEPLERLGPARGETAIRTLATYLDCQGSVVATARALHLHRNAVTYRLHRITALLGVDLADPDERLALHLACRARLLARPGVPDLPGDGPRVAPEQLPGPQVGQQRDTRAPGGGDDRVVPDRGARQQAPQGLDDGREGLVLGERAQPGGHRLGGDEAAAQEGQHHQERGQVAGRLRIAGDQAEYHRQPRDREGDHGDGAEDAQPGQRARGRPEAERQRDTKDNGAAEQGMDHAPQDVPGQHRGAGDGHGAEPGDDALGHVGGHRHRRGRRAAGQAQQDDPRRHVGQVGTPAAGRMAEPGPERAAEDVDEDEQEDDGQAGHHHRHGRVAQQVAEVTAQHGRRVGGRVGQRDAHD